MPELHDSRTRLLVDGLRRIADNGIDVLDLGPAGSSRLRLIARAALIRAGRPLEARQAAFDRQLVACIQELAFDGGVAKPAASSFPEPLPRGVVTDIPTEVGRLFLHPNDRVMTPFVREAGSWKRSESMFLRRRLGPGLCFVDVGSNVGYFSVLASGLVGATGRVIAVEPAPLNVQILKANLWRNGAANSVVLPIAAHRRNDFLALRENHVDPGDHEIGWADEASLLVPCARLDDLLAGLRIDVIRIDTKGTDHDVVAGLSGLLTRAATPEIISEFRISAMEARGIDPRRVAADYLGQGFSLALLDDHGEPQPTSPQELLDAAQSKESRSVNIILRRC